jgi:eukaryotic-like serine/threonine-protein kinase
MYIIAASFLGFFALVTYSTIWGVQRLGVNTDYRGDRMLLRIVAAGSPAERAGLQVGDQLLAVDGRTIHNGPDWEVIGANLEAGQPYHLEIERGGKRLEITLSLGRNPWKDFDTTQWATFLGLRSSQLVLLILALVIAFSRPQDFVARMGALFLAGIGTGWPEVPYGLAVTWRHLPPLVGGFLWIAEICSLAGSPAFFTFFAIFPRPLFRGRWVWGLVWAPAVAFISATFLHQFRMIYYPERALGVPDWALPTVALFVLAYVLGGLLALVLNYRRLEDINERRRMRVLVAGSLVGWLPFLAVLAFDFLIVPSQGTALVLIHPSVVIATIFVFMVFPLSFAYAILRHRLFDIRVMIRQGLQYALAKKALVSAVPALGGVLVLDLILHGSQPLIEIVSARGWIYAGLAGLAFVAHTKRERWMESLDRRFFRDRYDAQRILREVVEEVHRAGSFAKVAPQVVAKVEAALHPEFAALLVRESQQASYRVLSSAPSGAAPPAIPAESKLAGLVRLLGKPLEVPRTESGWLKDQLPHEETDFLRQARIDLLVPVAVGQDQTEAMLALGAKRSEEPYTREDQDLLVGVAASLALLLGKPAGAPARESEALEECPKCGTCYDTGAGLCAQDGGKLVTVGVPRALAGRYRLERRCGRGGMGAVYEATDTALERRVAVKIIRDDLLGNQEAAERFRREARAAAGFSHPNVVTVHDFGLAADSRAFLVMELLQGATLRDELKQHGRLAPLRTVEILRGVSSAAEAAHRRPLVHRDLKPENIFLARTDAGEVVKVLDFGIAKFLATATQATADSGTGQIIGTFAYMAPEQLQGQQPSPSWDLWALAVMAYEMLTGANPFAADNLGAMQTAILTGRFTPLASYLPDVPAKWQEFFDRSLAAESPRRPESASRFFSEIEHALVGNS